MLLNASQAIAVDSSPVPISVSNKAIARFDALDSWRGLAAIMVVLFHTQVVGNLYDVPLVRAGAAFVDFFFVLSGFVIAHAYASRIGSARALGKFMLVRFGRLYPLHLLMLALFVAFEWAKVFVPGLSNPDDAAFSGTNGLASIFTNFFLVQSLGMHDTLSWNTPAWSISAEFFVYVLFGLAVLLSGRALAMVSAAAAGVALFVLVTVAPEGMESSYDFGAVRTLYGFAIGAFLHQVAIGHHADEAGHRGRPRRASRLDLRRTRRGLVRADDRNRGEQECGRLCGALRLRLRHPRLRA